MKKPVKRGENTWRLTWEVGRDPSSGRRRQRTETFHGRKKDAEQRWREVQQRIERGTALDVTRLTFAELEHRWWSDALPLRNLAPKTLESYRETLDLHVLPVIGTALVQRLTTADVQACITAMRRHDRKDGEPSPRQRKYALGLIRQILTQGERWHVVGQNVARFADAPKQRRPDVLFWTVDETAAFLAAAVGRRLYPLYALGLATGMRLGELLALRWEYIDFAEHVVHVRWNLSVVDGEYIEKPPKTIRSTRTIAVGPQVMTVLASHSERMRSEREFAREPWPRPDLVFPSPSGTWEDPANVRKAFYRVCAKAAVRRITPHGMRHTHATQLLAAGVPVHVVSERLGHASVAITLDTYAHVLPHQQTDAARIADAVLGMRGDQIGTIRGEITT